MIKEKIFSDGRYKSAAKKMARSKGLHDDLFQEWALIICEKPDEDLKAIDEAGFLYPFCMRILLNLWNSNTSRFYYKYIKPQINDYHHYEDFRLSCEFEHSELLEIVDDLKDYISERHWYEIGLLDLYLWEYDCNASALSRQTGIPYRSILHTINTLRKDIKKDFKL